MIQKTKIKLDNGFTVSLITGNHYGYRCSFNTYEVAILDKNDKISYQLNEDVWGYQSTIEVLEIIKKASELK
jgi:hypothetical protein